VLGQLLEQQESARGLDLPGGDGGPLVVEGELAGLSGDAFEQIIDEVVNDAPGDTDVTVHLLQHLVDVDGVGFLPLVTFGNLLGGLANFCSSSPKVLGGIKPLARSSFSKGAALPPMSRTNRINDQMLPYISTLIIARPSPIR